MEEDSGKGMFWPVCGSTGLDSGADGGQLLPGSQSLQTLELGFSRRPDSASDISLLFLALHPLAKQNITNSKHECKFEVLLINKKLFHSK